jgi:ATP-dependent Clp protease ATP-binding subunit ClpB
MTSNLGSHLIQDSFEKITTGNQAFILEETRNQLMELLRKTIRPEFLNRIDETIIFTPLSRENIRKVVRLQFEQVIKRLSATDLRIDITEAAIDWLTVVGYEPHFGARPVKRILQKYVLNELSKRILSGTVDKSKTIVIDEENSELVFRNQAD